MKFGKEFWLILFREYISPNLFAVWTEKAGQEIDHATCWKIDRKGKLERWIMQHTGRCIEASLMDRKGMAGNG
jgi:hypothetical protein